MAASTAAARRTALMGCVRPSLKGLVNFLHFTQAYEAVSRTLPSLRDSGLIFHLTQR